MLRTDEDRERDRGGEAPMEIDSPPPLWLKPPTSNCRLIRIGVIIILQIINIYVGPATFHSPTPQTTTSGVISYSGLSTPSATGPSCLSGPPVTCNSSPLTVAVKTPETTPSAGFVQVQTSPVSLMTGSTGKSPLRSCHTNSDAVTHLRRLTTATFVNSSPPSRSPTVVRNRDLLIIYFNFITLADDAE